MSRQTAFVKQAGAQDFAPHNSTQLERASRTNKCTATQRKGQLERRRTHRKRHMQGRAAMINVINCVILPPVRGAAVPSGRSITSTPCVGSSVTINCTSWALLNPSTSKYLRDIFTLAPPCKKKNTHCCQNVDFRDGKNKNNFFFR
jgi:hypothetical protein